MELYVTVVEAVKIQSYVFGSNRLHENIGASYLVWAATEKWPFEAVLQVCKGGKRHNVTITGSLPDFDPTEKIENGADVEVVYGGGGNFMVLFREEDRARGFTTELSKRALEEAPGLRLLAATERFDWDAAGSLSQAVGAAFETLQRMKQAPEAPAPLLGLGVTVPCGSTGAPAVGWVRLPDGARQPASAEVIAKDRAAQNSDQRLRVQASVPSEFAFPREFDNLGRTHEEFSYIAVGHADGDSMGDNLKAVAEGVQDNREYIERVRNFSRALNETGQAAFEETLKALLERIEQQDGKRVIREVTPQGELVTEIELVKLEKERWYLPFRPLIFGGDDFTFVSDGRLGLALLMRFLREFKAEAEKKREAFAGRTVTASGGVAIVKAHYPFARAYSLAEALCHSAKEYRRELRQDVACLDWHFAQAGLMGSLGQIRERQLHVKLEGGSRGRLELRPVTLEQNPTGGGRDWPTVKKAIEAFRGDAWFGRRNKLKALMSALRGGRNAVKQFLDLYNDGRSLPVIVPSLTGWSKTGWQGDQCGYHDALELVDWYVSLQ